MFKKRKAPFGQNRFSKRNKDFDFREEDGYSSFEPYADSNSGVSESIKFRVYINSLFKSLGKVSHELLSGSDVHGTFVGNEDCQSKSLADRKALQAIVICISASLVLFFVLSSGLNRNDRFVREIKRAEGNMDYSLRAEFSSEEEFFVTDVELSVSPEKNEKIRNTQADNKINWLEEFASELIDRLNADTKGPSLELPSRLEDVSINWILPKEDEPTWIIAFGIFVSVYLWFSRYDKIQRQVRKYKAELEYEIPNMSRQLVLLLNAGLICDKAFVQLIEQTENKSNPLYKEMRKLYDKSRSDNSSFAANLYSFALDSGNRDLIRFATLVFEHNGRGSELVSKLESEANLQYESRMSIAKARAKAAETKLCFPLMLLLIALVIICIAPAMAEV